MNLAYDVGSDVVSSGKTLVNPTIENVGSVFKPVEGFVNNDIVPISTMAMNTLGKMEYIFDLGISF